MLKRGAVTKRDTLLKGLEEEYRYLVKINPTSYNETHEHHKKLQRCVSEMKRLRGVKLEGVAWLQEILDRPAPT